MTTLLHTPRSAHFPGMSHEFDSSYSDLPRATSSSFQPKQTGMSYAASYQEAAVGSSSNAGDAMFRFMPHGSMPPMETSSCPPDGPSHPIDFESDLTSVTMLGSHSSSSEIKPDLTDSSLTFPELPASLLDDAPEYEFVSLACLVARYLRTFWPFVYSSPDPRRSYRSFPTRSSRKQSTHTRVNVFEAPQGLDGGFADAAALGLGPDGTPLVGGTEYGLWSTTTDQSNEQAFQPDYLYQSAPFDAFDRQNLLSKNAGQSDMSLEGAPMGGANSADGAVAFDNLADPGDQRRPPAPFVDPQSTPNAQQVQGPGLLPDTSNPLGGGDFPPSVLYSSQGDSTPQRTTIKSDELDESQAGPSRTPLNGNRNLPNGQMFAFENGRPNLFHRASEDWSQSRRHSEDKVAGPRGPVVPSQAPGRSRLLSWQAGRVGVPGEGDWQDTMPEAMLNGVGPAYAPLRHGSLPMTAEGANHAFGHAGMPGNPMMPVSEVHPSASVLSSGIGAGPGPSQYAMMGRGPVGFAMHPQQRHHPYAMPMHPNGHYMGGHGMHNNSMEMINALGDAIDASIDAEGIARCPYPNCNKTFAKNRSYNLKAHLRSHSQMKPFACSVCPRAFSRKHDLERHARVHSGDKPYICEICGKGFPRSDALRRHWRVEKECGEKAAQLEAGQPLSAVMSSSHISLSQQHGLHDQGGPTGPQHHFNEHQAWIEAQRRRLG
ncbi:hypothetical protein ACQY0O_003486 [Thecaphora frezii]